MTEKIKRFEKTKNKLKQKVNPRAWMGYEHIHSSGQFIKDEVKRLFTINFSVQEKEQHDSYEKMMLDLSLTEDDLNSRKKNFLFATMLFCFLSLASLGYIIYQYMSAHYISILPSFVLCILFLTLAFRYHFWYFQLKVKRLGCSLEDWLGYISGKKS